MIFFHHANIIQEELLKAKTWKTPALNEQFIANLVLLRFPCSASVFAEVIFLYNMAGPTLFYNKYFEKQCQGVRIENGK